MSYSYHESYKHKLAKELLHRWLCGAEAGNDFCSFHGLMWRSNYGVHLELPFHETDSPYYFELSEGLYEFKGEDSPSGFNPSFNRGQILFVPDITIFHKGAAKILIEVVHTNHVSKDKIVKVFDFFKNDHVEVYEIEAENILTQTNKNLSLKFKNISKPWSCDEIKEETPKLSGNIPTLSEIREKYKPQ